MDKRLKIENLVGAKADFAWEGKEFRDMREPCVYVWLRGQEILYVGKGSAGIARPVSSSHHRLRTDAIRDKDKVLVFRCGRGMEETVEKALIAKLHPTLNRTNLSRINDSRTVRDALGLGKLSVAEILANNRKVAHENVELKRLVARVQILEDAEDRAALARPIVQGEYGPVFVTEDFLNQDLCGKVGYYDDDEVPERYADFEKHRENCALCAEADMELDDDDLPCEDGKELLAPQAVIYFEPGDFKSGNCVCIEHEFLAHVPERLVPEWLRELVACLPS